MSEPATHNIDSDLAGRLLASSLVTPDQLEEARDCIVESGGSLSAHLFRLGYASEPDLIEAISERLALPGVNLSGREIPGEAVDAIPSALAWNRLALPFDIEFSSRRLSVACLDPIDSELKSSLEEACPEYEIILHIALEPTLRSALARYYRRPEVTAHSEETRIAVNPEPGLPEPDLPDQASETTGADGCHLAVLSGHPLGQGTLGRLLTHQGYRVTWTDNLDSFIDRFQEDPPQIVLVLAGPQLPPIYAVVDRLVQARIDLGALPSFLISSDIPADRAAATLEHGFEDIVPVENILDLLMIKLTRCRERLQQDKARRMEIITDLGTHGTLTDMNVIDLIQTMSRTNKTMRVSVSGHGDQLTLYLSRGQLLYAEGCGLSGADAIYRALDWERGIWSVDSVAVDKLPQPNIRLTTEAVLLEGCRRLDEARRPRHGEDIPDRSDGGSSTGRISTFFDNLS